MKLLSEKAFSLFASYISLYNFIEILYPIFDYPHEHYTFKHF